MMLWLFAKTCTGGGGFIDPGHLPQTCADNGTAQTIYYILLSLVGALAFFFFVLAGLRYVLSKGEPQGVESAKNELKYSIIGLIIVGAAALIVKYALGRL